MTENELARKTTNEWVSPCGTTNFATIPEGVYLSYGLAHFLLSAYEKKGEHLSSCEVLALKAKWDAMLK